MGRAARTDRVATSPRAPEVGADPRRSPMPTDLRQRETPHNTSNFAAQTHAFIAPIIYIMSSNGDGRPEWSSDIHYPGRLADG